ncbi:hypothetical protein L1049_020904 [Liquidambar formosana]|uniref:Uncharacterized protein n=1 Tax=Liquidambar formosana TaxID=63359 RepID=A0AAP0S8J2_LIQFO
MNYENVWDLLVVLCGEALVKLSFPIAENGVLVKHCELLFRSGASLLSTTDCLSPKQRRWPEDMAWHPQGDSLVSVYSADGGDSQISVMDLNKRQEVKVMGLKLIWGKLYMLVPVILRT